METLWNRIISIEIKNSQRLPIPEIVWIFQRERRNDQSIWFISFNVLMNENLQIGNLGRFRAVHLSKDVPWICKKIFKRLSGAGKASKNHAGNSRMRCLLGKTCQRSNDILQVQWKWNSIIFSVNRKYFWDLFLDKLVVLTTLLLDLFAGVIGWSLLQKLDIRNMHFLFETSIWFMQSWQGIIDNTLMVFIHSDCKMFELSVMFILIFDPRHFRCGTRHSDWLLLDYLAFSGSVIYCNDQ